MSIIERIVLENSYLVPTPLTSTVNEFLLKPDVNEAEESLILRVLREANQNALTSTKNIFLEEAEGSFEGKKKKCKKKKQNKGPDYHTARRSFKKRRLLGRANTYRSLSRSIEHVEDYCGDEVEREGFDQAMGFSVLNEATGPTVFGGASLDQHVLAPMPPGGALLSVVDNSAVNFAAPTAMEYRMASASSGSQILRRAPQMQQLFSKNSVEFCFGSAAKHPFGATPIPACISLTEMPAYNFKIENFGVEHLSQSLKFSFEDIDNFHLEKVQNMTSKKMQLYSAASMALMCSANFKNADDSFRNFIELSANAVRPIDPEFILKVAIYSRQELNIKSVSNFLLAYAAYYEETRLFLDKYFEASIRLPSDWLEVADIYQTFKDERLKTGSLPAALKKVLKSSFKKFDEYQLAKYNRDKTKKDKAKPHGFTLKQLIRLLHIDSPATEVMCLLGKKYPEDGEQFKKSGLPGIWDSKMAGKRMKLPLPITWETQVSANGNKASVWEGIIDANKLPYMAMLRNIRNVIISGISQKHHDKVLKYLENKNAVINSRQVPLQFFEAYKVVEELEELLTKDKEEICKPNLAEWKKKHTEKIYEKIHKVSSPILSCYKKAIDEALEISSLHNLSPIPGKTLILCDTAFLSHELDKKKRRNIQKKTLETCVMLGLMIKKACEHCNMYLIDEFGADKVSFKDEESFLQVLRRQCEDNHLLFIRENTTNCIEGLKSVFNFFLKQQVILSEKLDHIIFLRVSDAKEYEKTVSSFLNKYRETINSDLLYTDINLVLSSKSFSGKHSDDERDVYLSGNSPQLIRFIAERSNDGQLTCVENIDVKYDLKSKHNSFPIKKVSSECIEETAVSPFSKEPKWHSLRIFISSTFKDMHSERDMLVRYIMPELRRRAATVFVKLNEVDLRWGITEADCTTKRAAELCLFEAQRCDLFIGMLGQRYGTLYTYGTPDCPELQWVKDYPQSLSITELEMHAGALRPEKLANKKAFFYFRSPNFLK